MSEFGEGAPEAKVPSEPKLEALKSEEKISPGYPEALKSHWRVISIDEAKELVYQPEFLGLRPSLKELPHLVPDAQSLIEDFRTVIGFILEDPRRLATFPRRPDEKSKLDREEFERWLEETVESIGDEGLKRRITPLRAEIIQNRLERQGQDNRLYLGGISEETLMEKHYGIKEGFRTESPLWFIERCRDEYYQAIYTTSMIEGIKDFVGVYYPELVIDWPYQVETLHPDYTEYRMAEGKKHIIVRGFDWHLSGKSLSRVNWASPYEVELDPVFELTKLVPKGFKLVNDDFSGILHEMMHGKYHEITETERDLHPYSLSSALYEGFPCMIDFHMSSLLLRDASIWELGKRDLKEIEELRRLRIEYRKNTKDYYSDGVQIFDRLFKRGGVEEMIKFLRRVDLDKCNKIMEGSSEYEAALKDSDNIPMKPEASAKTP